MLLTKEVEVKVSTHTFKYYKELGYNFEHVGDIIIVKIDDLTKGSRTLVDLKCDYCDKPITKSYINYIQSRKNTPKDACSDCIHLKTSETVTNIYGVDNYFKTEEFKENNKKYNMDKYGVENPSQREDVKNKRTQTFLNKYGVENPFQAEEVKEKIKQTVVDKYGVEYVQQSKKIREKSYETLENKYGERYTLRIPEFKKKYTNTMIERYGTIKTLKNPELLKKYQETSMARYGVNYPNKNPKILKKIRETMYNNNTVPTSCQQIYLHNLYGGELNYPISCFNADICLLDDNIELEYNGGGHFLQVKLGELTKEEFNQKEIIRNNIIKRAGFKQIIITSSKDFLPSDEILLKMLEQAKQYFNTTNHTWIEYNIDTSLMRNAENKEGVFFDFGELRKIKKAS